MNPWACYFHLEGIFCGPGTDYSSWLTAAQLRDLQKIYRGWIDMTIQLSFQVLLLHLSY